MTSFGGNKIQGESPLTLFFMTTAFEKIPFLNKCTFYYIIFIQVSTLSKTKFCINSHFNYIFKVKASIAALNTW